MSSSIPSSSLSTLLTLSQRAQRASLSQSAPISLGRPQTRRVPALSSEAEVAEERASGAGKRCAQNSLQCAQTHSLKWQRQSYFLYCGEKNYQFPIREHMAGCVTAFFTTVYLIDFFPTILFISRYIKNDCEVEGIRDKEGNSPLKRGYYVPGKDCAGHLYMCYNNT